MAFLIGVVLAFMGAVQLRQFGAEIFVVDLIAIAVLRELGILLTAIIVAGRSASAFTASIGSMKMREEIDAMRTLGLDPMQILVLPRVLALVITLPLLGVVANFAGLIGGATMAWIDLGVSPGMFVVRLNDQIGVWHYPRRPDQGAVLRGRDRHHRLPPRPQGRRQRREPRPAHLGLGRARDLHGDRARRDLRDLLRGGERLMAEEVQREAIIEVRGVVNRFGTQVVHDGLDLDVYRGEVLGHRRRLGHRQVGAPALDRRTQPARRRARSASSASTFSNTSEAEREAVSRRWGVLFQQGALFSALTVQQNVEAPMRELLHDRAAPPRGACAAQDLHGRAAADACAKYPSELSGGMQKRAGLARALALDPEIVFLDEPTAGLDPIGAAAFDDLIRELKETLGLTVFMVTHDLDSLHAICDRIAVLAEKKVLVTGTMADMLKVDHPWVHEYFHGPRARAAMAAV